MSLLSSFYEAYEAFHPFIRVTSRRVDRRTGETRVTLTWDSCPEFDAYKSAYFALDWSDRSIACFYMDCRIDGTSPKLAEMFAEQRGPSLVTDNTFLSDNANGKQFEDCQPLGDTLKMFAEREGQSVKGKKYISQLARYPGDPEAWVDGRGDVKRICERRGWNCSGDVKVGGDSQARVKGSGRKRPTLRIPRPDAESVRRINDGSIRAPG